jgi:putative oxidoreductase
MTAARRIPALPQASELQHRLAGPVLSLLRAVAGFLFACHGAQTLFGALGGVPGFPDGLPVGSWPMWWAGVIELAAGGLVMLGLFTRPAALLCSGAMAYAYLTVHLPMGLWPLQNLGEQAALNAWVFLAIAVLGPGPWSLDAVLHRLFAPAEDTSSAGLTR